MRKLIALAALVAGLSFAGTAAHADSCCSGGKCGKCGKCGTCCKGCTTCGPNCSPKTCCK